MSGTKLDSSTFSRDQQRRGRDPLCKGTWAWVELERPPDHPCHGPWSRGPGPVSAVTVNSNGAHHTTGTFCKFFMFFILVTTRSAGTLTFTSHKNIFENIKRIRQHNSRGTFSSFISRMHLLLIFQKNIYRNN